MRQDDDAERLLLSEETLSVEKRSLVTGRIRVHAKTENIDTVAQADLEGEAVEVTRIPVDREVDAPPQIRTEGDVTILPVVEEVLVVEKRLYLKEEIHIRRRPTLESVEIPVTLRRQHAVLERIDPETGDVTTETISTSEANDQ
jgi:uncharacterized protein (TIGR02271 family)